MKTTFFILMLLVSINFTNAQNRSAIEIGTGKTFFDKDLAKNTELSNPWTFNFRYIYTSLPTGDIHVNAGFKSFSLSHKAENQTYKDDYLLLLVGVTYFHNLIEPDVYYLQAMGGYQYSTYPDGKDSKFHQLNIGISGGIDKLRLNLYYSYSLSGQLEYRYYDPITETDISYKYRISSINLTLTYLFGH
jgi:hypothetical protein